MLLRRGGLQSNWRRKLLPVAVASCFSGPAAWANPTGPVVVQGQASIAAQGNTLTVTNTPGTVINWQAFSIAGNEITRFIQQSQSSSVLNRVVGVNPSMILGALQSNGRVFLVNPNGITIGAGAQIDVAGFLASTLNLSDADFLAGRMRFTDHGSAGSVVNHGSIATAAGGMVYLVGRDVQNSGIIRSPQGEIMLAAGKSVELVDVQTPEVRVQVTAPDNQAINLGQMIASGGRIGMYGTLVKHDGVASANTAVMGENGRIVFRAVKDVTLGAGSMVTASGAQGGSVVIQGETGSALVSGSVAATGSAGHGGSVQVLGQQVGLFDGAGIDASGRSGGGTVLVGGDFQGGNAAVQNASRTYFGAGATIAADATETGNGGKVILWSDEVTRAFGSVSARGGAQTGNGGLVEISGKRNLVYSGTVSTLAPHGTAGLLLLDPADLDIVATGDLDVSAASPFAPLGGDGAVSTLGWDTITGAGGLGGGNVVITTVGTPVTGSETGRIRIQATGVYNSASSLTFSAAGAIEVNAAVTNNGSGALTLDAQGGTLDIAQTLTTTGGAIHLSGSAGINLGANLLSGGGAITINNALALTTANPVINAGAGNIGFSSMVDGGANSLTTSNTGTLSFGGAISNMADLNIQGGPSSVALPQTTLSGNLSLTSAGHVTQTGKLTVTGTSDITASSGDVALAGFDNSFGGAVTASASGLVALRTDATPLVLGNVSAGGGGVGLYLNGDVSQSGGTAISSGGAVLVEANAAGLNVNLSSATNDFGGGAITLATAGPGTFNNVSVRDTNAAAAIGALPANIGGNLMLHFDNAGMTVPGVTVGGNLSLTAGGPVSVSGNVSSTGTAELTTTSGDIALGADFGSSGAATTLISAGNITRTAGTVGGTDVILDAAAGIGAGPGARVLTAAGNLAARSTVSGGVFVSEIDEVTLTTLSGVVNAAAGGAAYDLTAGGTITVSAAVNAGPATGSTTLATTGGNIALGADVGNASGVTTLTSAGEITRTAGSVIGSGVLLDAADAIGSSGARIATMAGTLAARTGAGASGGIFITEADNVSLGTVGAVSGVSAGNGGEADLRTTAGDITLAANVSATGSGNVTLIAGGGAGNDLIAGAGRVSTGSGLVTLQGDAVGTTVAPILTDLGSGTLAATSSAGDIAISNNTAGGLNTSQLTGLTTGGGVQTVSIVQSAGNLTVGGSLNVGGDTLVLGASAGDLLGGAGTLTAGALTLNASGLIGGASAVNTNTSGTLTLNSGGSAAAGNITVSEANALPVSRVSLGGAGAGSGRSVKLTSVAGPITIDAAIGNAADHLELVAMAGDIAGGAGTISATNLVLNAAAGIGAGTAVNTNTSGNLGLTTAGNGTAGDIALVESNALNTTRVTTLTTGGTGTQSVSLTAPSITLGAAIGDAADNLTLVAGSGTISGSSILTANDLRLDAHDGIGSAGTPVLVNTAGSLAARLTNASATGDIVVEEVAAGAGLTVGTANGLSGVTTTNNRGITLSAVSGNIVLNQIVSSGSGQVSLITTGSGDVSVAAGISSGPVSIVSAGTISDSAQISGSMLTTSSIGGTILDFGHAISGFNASNISGGNIQLVNTAPTLTVTGISQNGGGNVIVNNTGALTVDGAINNAGSGGAISLTGSAGINLNQNLTATDGAVTLNNSTTLGAPVQIAAGTGTVTLTGAVNIGSHDLTVGSSGITTLTGGISGSTGNVDIAAATRTDVDGAIALSGAGSVRLDRAVVSGVNVTTTGGGITFDGAASTDTGPVQIASGGGNVLFNDTLTLGSGAGLTVLSGAGTASFGGAVNGPAGLTVTASGNTIFSSTVGAGTALASLATDGGGVTQLNGGSVATTGGQNYSDAVTLGANTTLTANSITFGSTLNSAGAARTLQINDSGTTTFSGTVGNSLALASLTTNAGGSTAINTTTVNTTGAQTYNDAVTLGADAVLTSSGGSDIRFLSTLDGASGLTVNTTGATVFSGAVGSATPLAFLTTNSGGTTQVNGGSVATTGAQTYNDAVTIGGATTFSATATSAALDFNSTLAAAAHALTLSADEINMAGGAGSVTGTGTVTLQTNNASAAINIGSAAGATVGALDLAAGDIAALAGGFAALQIGRSDGAHAISIGNASFLDPLLVRAPTAGTIGVNGALSGAQQITLDAGGAVQGAGSVAAPLVKVVAGGIGSFATPLQIDAPSIDILNSAGDAVIRTPGSVTLSNNFRNTASGGELRLITQNGAINTAAVAVQSAGGRIALIANDTAGGSIGGITVGSGGISSGGGDIVLHAADNITVNGSMAAGSGSMRMMAGTGPGIGTSHALFSGSNPAAATESTPDDFGMITLNAPVSAASMVLVSSTSSATTVVPVITQGPAGVISTTGALTAVSLRGGGAPGNGGGTIDLNDAIGNNSTGLINLFACSFGGCPGSLPTAPFINTGTPVPPFTTALYSDGQLFYSDVGGTNVTGIGTSGDFMLYTPGSVNITGPSLSAKNLTIEALHNINVDLLAPFTNNDINGGQPGGSLNFIAGQNVSYTSVTSGATIGTATTPFNHDLRFQAAGNVIVANAIHVGTGNFVVRANQPVSLNNGAINIAATGSGSVVMQGNHVVSSQADITVSGVNLTLQGGDAGSLNQASAGQQLLANGNVNLDLIGGVTVTGGTATANSDSAAIIRGGVVNVGSAATPVASLSMTGGTATVSGTTDRVADALIEGTTALNVRVAGNVGLTGGTATIASTAGSTQKAGASAILKGKSLLFNVTGNVTLTGGTAGAATGGNTATAGAQVTADSAFSPVIQGDLNLVGGDATAQPISGEIANAVASARFESSGDLLLKVSGDIDLKGGQAVAINNAGGSFGEADASAFVRSGARISIQGGQDFDVTGGSATTSGSAIRAIASAGVITGDLSTGETLLVNTAGNMRLTGGSGSGAAADAAALLFSGGEAKLTISGSGGLRLEGGSGPFFPPFDSGVFLPNSNLFHMIGDNALVQIPGSAYPITVTGLVTIVPNPAKGAALFVSEAPPLSLDSLLAAFIRTTDCVSFNGGACTLSEAAAAGARRGAKDPAGGVCR
jgi:filamentous hemagglutinin family protein